MARSVHWRSSLASDAGEVGGRAAAAWAGLLIATILVVALIPLTVLMRDQRTSVPPASHPTFSKYQALDLAWEKAQAACTNVGGACTSLINRTNAMERWLVIQQWPTQREFTVALALAQDSEYSLGYAGSSTGNQPSYNKATADADMLWCLLQAPGSC